MKKLIELLNEFETPQSGVVFKSYDDYDGTFYGVDCDGETEIAWSDAYICSKRFQFIKWLVENEKIDHKKIEDETYVKVNGEWYELILGCHYDLYQQTLMLLAIQDKPVEFLISILKDDATEKVDTLLKGVKKTCESFGI